MKTCKRNLHQYPDDALQCLECKQLSKKIWKDKNSQKIKLDKKKWAAENATHLISYRRDWYLNNTDKVKNTVKSYREANVGKTNALSAKRNAFRLNATPKWLTKEQLNSVSLFYQAAKWVESILSEKIHVDHIIPLRGKEVSGLHVPWNLQLLTRANNCSKSNKV